MFPWWSSNSKGWCAPQELVLGLPEAQFLLEVNTGELWPKAELFKTRRPPMMPSTHREYPDLYFGQSMGATGRLSGMMTGMQQQGTTTKIHSHNQPILYPSRCYVDLQILFV